MEKNQIRKKIAIVTTQKIVIGEKAVVKNEKSLLKHVQKRSSPEMEVRARRSKNEKIKIVSRYQKNSSSRW